MKRAKPDGRGLNQDALSAEADRLTSTSAVNRVRAFLQQLSRSSNDQDCVVCYVLTGTTAPDHRSGKDCPEHLCAGETEWSDFNQRMRFDRGRSICYYCYLPTVSSPTRRGEHQLTTCQNEKTDPGAKHHFAPQCPTPHLIKPALYAFWQKGPDDLREYVTAKVSFRWHSLDVFVAWLKGVDTRTRLGNHILLFWWILEFWGEPRH